MTEIWALYNEIHIKYKILQVLTIGLDTAINVIVVNTLLKEIS